MSKKFNEIEARELAKAIHQKRASLDMTLVDLEKITGVNCGQISRFENGQFRFASKNLQKVLDVLQIRQLNEAPSDGLGTRVEKFAKKSPFHRLLIEDLLKAIEYIDSIKHAD